MPRSKAIAAPDPIAAAAIYARVSTNKRAPDARADERAQNLELQIAPLLELCRARGYEPRVFSDRASAIAPRPQWDELMREARRGKFAAVIVWRFDRAARSLRDLVNTLEELSQLGIQFISHREAIDTSTSYGRALFGVSAVFAQLERDILRERVQAGMDYAREHGTKSGNAIGRPRAIFNRERLIADRKEGYSLRELAKRHRVSIGTAAAAVKAAAEQ